MILIIGSSALVRRGIDIGRIPVDCDIIARPSDALEYIMGMVKGKEYKISYSSDVRYIYAIPVDKNDKIFEVEIAWPETTALSLLEILESRGRGMVSTATVNEVFALKASHKYKKNSAHFQKTRKDIMVLRAAGARIPKYLKEWYKERVRETYNYKHPKLKGVKKDEFFSDDGIRYVYDHDAIHEVVKHLDRPAYRFFQPDGEEIHTSKEDFFAQPHSTRILAVLEEAYVLSLERSIIPFTLWGDEQKMRKAFDIALEKVCTSITSGWFRKFAYDNYDEVASLYNNEYVYRFHAMTASNSIKLHQKEANK